MMVWLLSLKKKWNAEIFGSWVAQLFYNEDWNRNIELKYWIENSNASNILLTKGSDVIINNLMVNEMMNDFKKLEEQKIISNSMISYRRINDYDYFDYAKWGVSVNGNVIVLYAFGDKEHNHKIKPKLFRSSISIWDVKIYNIWRIVNRIEIINWYDSKNINILINYSQMFGFKLRPKQISSCMSYVSGRKDYLVLYGPDRMLLFDKCIPNICGMDAGIESSYGKIRIIGYNDLCKGNCVYNHFEVSHYHQHIFLEKKSGEIVHTNAVFVEYGSVNVANNMKIEYESMVLRDFIDFGDLYTYKFIWDSGKIDRC